MVKWIRYDCEEFDSEESARDAAAGLINIDDIVAQVGNELTTWDLIKELARLDSPLYYNLLDAAIKQAFEDYFSEVDDEEEFEENS